MSLAKLMFFFASLCVVCVCVRDIYILFNDALNTFFNLRLYGVWHMVKDHSDSEKGNPLSPLHGLLFMINSKG